MDLDGFLSKQRWVTDCRQEGIGKRQPARCSRKTHDKFAIASIAKKLLHCCTGAHARVVEIYTYICAYAYIYTYVYMHIYMHMYIYICLCIYVCVCVCTYIYIYACMYTHIYVHVYVYIYMYIFESICIFVESMHAFTGVVEHHTCAGVYVRHML